LDGGVPLHIHHGPHLVPLVEALAETLAAPLADPFTADVVSVPTAGMRDWLQQQLGLRLGAGPYRDGIAANIEMVFPGRFRAAALGNSLDSTSPWDIERLTWTVLEVLSSGAVEVPGWRPGGHGTYSTARHIADLFDRYAINRPQLIQQWAAGHDGDGTVDDHEAVIGVADDHAWQPRLWRVVRAAIGRPPDAEILPDLLADVRAGRLEPQLPERAAVFGVSGLSAAQLEVVRAVAEVIDIHVFVAHPSPRAWADARQQLGGRLVLRAACDATAAVNHPLLRSWGRPAMEAAVLVAGTDADVAPTGLLGHGWAVGAPVDHRHGAPRTLLAQIQADLATDATPGRALSLVPADPSAAGAVDPSIQVHCCHGAVRQLEVLRDALGAAFAADHTLQAHDVVVLCPDLARFAPLVQSVFARSTLPIPARVSDLSLGSGNPVAGALLTVLEVIGGRCTGPQILSVCSLDPVRAVFGFDDEAIERIDRWMNELGVTWGLDVEQRAAWLDDDIAEGTWSAVLDRVLLGAAMPAPTRRVGPSGIVPYDDVDSAAFVTAGRLAEVIRRLGALRDVASARHPIESWVATLTTVVDSLLTAPAERSTPEQTWQSVQVLEALADIGENAGDGANTVPLAINDVRVLLAGAIAEQFGRLNLRSGAVTVTAMVPVRNLPARVVCVLGLDEGTLRATGVDGDDILVSRPCVGERDPRAEGRHLLLDALMAAGDHFIVTCDGSDITTNRELPLPVVVNELIDIVHATRPGVRVVRRHPRQAFDEANFGVDAAGQPCEPFSFDRGMLAAAQVRRMPLLDSAPLPMLAPLLPATVAVGALAESACRPARTYLGQRLDVRLPKRIEEVDTDIPLALGPLDLWSVATELLDLHRDGASADVLAAWQEAMQRSGELPPRELARAAIAEVDKELGMIFAAPAGADVRTLLTAKEAIEVDIAIAVSGARLRVVDTIKRVHEHRIARVDFNRPRRRHVVLAAAELAALVITDPSVAWEAIVINRPKAAGNRSASVTTLRPTAEGDADAARRFLTVLADLHLRALREPVPLFDQSSYELYESGNFDDEKTFASDLNDNHTSFVWSDMTADEILAMPLLSDDELPALEAIAATTQLTGGGRAHAFARYLWCAFDEFVAAS
jgi:exodeoxyribonuclease V gamma subunit